ncbi:hypothetical protein [uncultured Pseudoalteromonas sp.]|uniref:hypothetical protein n=1 Tax=uncultured Pseudoalteromonas sp. TaxID=114053 RepID=UPI0025996DA3|nr:hypothetical protein [uncultured Pseudoalteromonas sp.]
MNNKILKFFTRCIKIDESRALHKNCSFWFALLTPAIIALLLSLNLTRELVIHKRFDFGFTVEHLDSFVKYYKFPIGLLPISILLSVMVARFHASKQTVQQTHLKNYFEHHEHFEAYCTYLEKQHLVNIHSRELYLLLYPASTIVSFSATPSSDIIDNFVELTETLMNSDDEGEFPEQIVENYELITEFETKNMIYYKENYLGEDVMLNLNILDWHENMSLVLKDLYAFKGNLISLDSLNAMTDIFRDLNMKLKLSSY